MHYLVTRPFPGADMGDIIDGSTFKDVRRIRQMTDLRYIRPLAEGEVQQAGVSVAEGEEEPAEGEPELVSTPVRTLREILPSVDDKELLQRAYEADERKVAKQLYAERMEKL